LPRSGIATEPATSTPAISADATRPPTEVGNLIDALFLRELFLGELLLRDLLLRELRCEDFRRRSRLGRAHDDSEMHRSFPHRSIR